MTTPSVVAFQSALVGWSEGLKTGLECVASLTIVGAPLTMTTTGDGDALKNAVVQGTLIPGE
jgi:hypothetical protein